MKENLKEFWYKNFSIIIPIFFAVAYCGMLIYIYYKKIDVDLIQDSENFETMLETIVTFMSIILSVFGFLIPSFIGAKGKSETMNYFWKYADMKLFAYKLKNVVAIGLITIFVTCVLFLKDIFSELVCNMIIIVWLYMFFYFLCSSYRFISIMINTLLTEKETFMQKVANKVSVEDKKIIDDKIEKI